MSEMISVIVPVYKVEPYLRKCLDSIVSQTYQNLQIILVDDGSPDGCGAICDEYATRDGRVQVIHTKNRGAFAARNLALDRACGDYIGFVDADDWLEARMYEVLAGLLEQYDADIAQCEAINEGPYHQIRGQRLGGVRVYRQSELTEAMFREQITHSLCNKLFRADIFENRRFPEDCYHMDAAFIAGVGQLCRSVVRTDEALYHYNTTNISITRGQKNPKHIRSAERLFEAYSAAARQAPGIGGCFICREIPSAGRLIRPGGEISRKMAVQHIRAMHGIFLRHWDDARKTPEYAAEPWAKRLLWHIYRRCPGLASALVAARAGLKRRANATED